MKNIVIAFLLTCPLLTYSQDETTDIDSVFVKVEESASFPGGVSGWGQYLAKTMKYPEQAQRLGIEGRVFIQFIVEKDGSLSNVKVVKGIGAGCDQESVRVLRDGPKWIPARVDGRPVRQKMIQNILFRFHDPKRNRKEKRANRKKGN